MSSPEQINAIKDQLGSIFENYGVDLPINMWASEKDRWLELLICVINQVKPEPNIEEVRELVEIWEKMDLTSPKSLSKLKVESQEYSFLLFILNQYGFNEKEAILALQVAISLSKTIDEHYAGKIQYYIRKYFDTLRTDMTQTFEGIGLSSKQTRFAVTHWLQNTMNAPLSIGHKAAENFCHENNIDETVLIEAADGLDINLAVIDDLLERKETLKSLVVDITEVKDKI